MDSALRAQGLYRKRVAKDGSCLFRAVAEQVLHSQSRHIDVRMACIDYLRKNREKFEAFIEGSFEDYLKCLENPQEWVGQVEISALSLMYKKDIIIYQEPNAAPSCVTENGFPDKVLLCFSNGNHYDVVYPIEYAEKAALCQSVLYELLYHKVFGIDVNKILEELHAPDVTEESNGSSEISSESEADDNYKSKTAAVSDMNGLKSRSGSKHLKTNGNPTSFTLPRKVVKSLNPSVYRNVEYEVWQQSKRDQQKRDFSIAAGMQYSVGDKCKVRLDHNGKLYNAHIQEVCSENGPVVVFVEELGAKHSVSLKSLKPLPQASPMEAWNTVSGKKIKKFPPTCGQNVQPDADCRRPKNQNKPIKTQSVLPPRLQHAVGTRQHQFSNSGPQSQQTSAEQKTLGSRSASQAVRKADRERTEDLDYASRDCNYFGLSPEERREKQAIEESRSLYEIQQRDEQAFPALSNQSATQTADTFNQKRFPVVSEGRNSKWGSDVEERKDKDSESRQMHLNQKLEPNSSERNGGDEKYPEASPPLEQAKTQSLSPAEQRLTEHLPCVNPAASPVFSEVHLPPTVPSLPAIVPAWPNEPTTYGPTGIPGQMPVSSLMPPPTTGPDSVVSQAQVTSAPVAGVPVSVQAVNQPLMPLPQTLNPYQDPLYPGFPFNEKGERAIAPPYSLCSTDLPKDKSILRFFFNLGIKAYSCPMWAPHSYLYPLHQAYVAACRMYPNVSVPVYPHNPWFQETLLTSNESETAQTNRHFPMQSEARCNGQSSQVDSRSPSLPLLISTAQVSESQGPVCVESENPVQGLHTDYDDSLRGKNMFPQPPFGHSQFLGAVPIASPFFPHFWYGYPFQGFIENSVVRPNVVMSPEDKGATATTSENLYLAKEGSSPVPVTSFVEQLQKTKSDSSSNAVPPPVASVHSECDVLNETSARVPKMEQIYTAASAEQTKAGLPNRSPQIQGVERQTVMSSALPSLSEPSKNELKSTVPSRKEKADKARDPKTAGNVQTSSGESRAQRTKEESSEDEHEVSDMLRSGRPKQFYNQTYGGGRRPRNEWGYPSRGGYQYPRGEEAWKGPPNRGRDEGYQYHRNFRGRPYRNDKRRATLGDGQRGHQI
ncbi:OTU domain-containing protein 4 isoform X1 [Alligator sinensis]|uniref:OTU domain-containing protein 4 n=2 Tax=Alligator sinensis TaxID=38654 RepID=A0A1U7RPR6_ALLSI|nr:OTU domain-containing protein 4 isoform X1 [Alligator sinensis]XP_025060096.1 OTU domain-containing protein 4 isoform X1 [Alligator sinensis]